MNKNKWMEKFSLKSFSAKDKVLILASFILFGVLLISLSGGIGGQNAQQETGGSAMSAESYKNSLQAEMKKTLSQVVGVGDVEVMITLEGEVSKEIAYNETKSGSASSDPASRVSEQTTLSRDAVMVKSSDGTTPYTLEDKYPAVLGVVVVAEGAENSQTKYYIVNAVKTALDVPSHKIVVLPKKSN